MKLRSGEDDNVMLVFKNCTICGRSILSAPYETDPQCVSHTEKELKDYQDKK